MTELLALPPGGRVLEVGTGSGYQAAVLAEITPHVYTIEIVEPLAASARERLARLGYRAVQVRAGDGYFGWPEAAPFDGIIVPCAADAVPDAMWEQLRPGGRIVIPLGQAGQIQELTVIAKHPDGSRSASRTIPCAFVPMTGAAQDRP
jgi:protein-L-isoaspartate(D-aspartate) O-methyltransferase